MESGMEWWTSSGYSLRMSLLKNLEISSYSWSIIIYNVNRDGQVKPISNSRDTQEIPFAEVVKVFEVFENYLNTNTILEHFEYYDMRQENYEKSNQSQP